MRRALWPLIATIALAIVLAVGVFPTRTWLEQREAIQTERERIAVLDRENTRLAARVAELQTDGEIERLAREQYNLVKPGEEAYAILPGPNEVQPPPSSGFPTPAPSSDGWWDGLKSRLGEIF